MEQWEARIETVVDFENNETASVSFEEYFVFLFYFPPGPLRVVFPTLELKEDS
jgi:hypothetical protein